MTAHDELWQAYQTAAVSPDDRVAARQRAEERAEKARGAGVYERVLETAGTTQWSTYWLHIRPDE